MPSKKDLQEQINNLFHRVRDLEQRGRTETTDGTRGTEMIGTCSVVYCHVCGQPMQEGGPGRWWCDRCKSDRPRFPGPNEQTPEEEYWLCDAPRLCSNCVYGLDDAFDMDVYRCSAVGSRLYRVGMPAGCSFWEKKERDAR